MREEVIRSRALLRNMSITTNFLHKGPYNFFMLLFDALVNTNKAYSARKKIFLSIFCSHNSEVERIVDFK